MLRSLLLTVLLALAACEPPSGAPVSLTVEDFVQTMRQNEIHHIRLERNRPLSEKSRAKAYDLYVNQQQMMILQLAPEMDPANFRSLFDGYVRQGYEVHVNDNLMLVAKPDVQKDILEAFQSL